MNCSKCNSQIPSGSSVCPYCGGVQATGSSTEIQGFDSRDSRRGPIEDDGEGYSQALSEPGRKPGRKAIVVWVVSLLVLAALILVCFLLCR